MFKLYREITNSLTVTTAFIRTVRGQLDELAADVATVNSLQARIEKSLERLVCKKYPVIITVDGFDPDNKNVPVNMGSIVWLQMGESKEIRFQPWKCMYSLTIKCNGGIISDCSISNEAFVSSSGTGMPAVTEIKANRKLTPVDVMRLVVSLPEKI